MERKRTKEEVDEILREWGALKMWYHDCEKQSGTFRGLWTEKGKHCNWCGINEEGKYD